MKSFLNYVFWDLHVALEGGVEKSQTYESPRWLNFHASVREDRVRRSKVWCWLTSLHSIFIGGHTALVRHWKVAEQPSVSESSSGEPRPMDWSQVNNMEDWRLAEAEREAERESESESESESEREREAEEFMLIRSFTISTFWILNFQTQLSKTWVTVGVVAGVRRDRSEVITSPLCVFLSVTCVAESPLLVPVVVVSGGAPQPAICASIFGARRVRLLHESEGEHAHVAIMCPWNAQTYTSTTFILTIIRIISKYYAPFCSC